MQFRMNEIELRLLVYMHEHARGFKQIHFFDPEKVRAALKITEPEHEKAGTYLEGFDLIADANISNCCWYLTSNGEAFVRQVEAEMQKSKKIANSSFTFTIKNLKPYVQPAL